MPGISQPHCSGFWVTLGQAEALARDEHQARFVLMPRLNWLAPWKAPLDSGTLSGNELMDALRDQMGAAPAPVMVAVLREEQGWLVEQRRGFVVPDDWREQAEQRRLAGTLPA
jgi:hypothetical protein